MVQHEQVQEAVAAGKYASNMGKPQYKQMKNGHCRLPGFSTSQPGETYYYSEAVVNVFGIGDESLDVAKLFAYRCMEGGGGGGGARREATTLPL